MYRTVISQNYTGSAKRPYIKRLIITDMEKGHLTDYKSSLPGVFVYFCWKMYKNIEKYIKNW